MRHWRKMGIAFVSLYGATFGSATASASCTVKQVGALNVTMENGVPVATGQLNGHPVRLGVHSDAFYSMISPEAAREFGLSVKAISTSFDFQKDGRSVPAGRAYVDSLKMSGPWLIEGVNFIVTPGFDGLTGIIGQNILGRRDVEYDLAHGVIRSSYAENCLGQSPAYWAGNQPVMSLPIEAMDDLDKHTIGTVFVNGMKLRASFDTSGETYISTRAAGKLRVSVADHQAKFDLDLGGEKLRGATLNVADFGSAATDIRIGLDFFRTHRVYVANGMRRMFFTYAGGPVFGMTPEIDGVPAANASK